MKRNASTDESQQPTAKRPKEEEEVERAPARHLTILECRDIAQTAIGLPAGPLLEWDLQAHKSHPLFGVIYAKLPFTGLEIRHDAMCVTLSGKITEMNYRPITVKATSPGQRDDCEMPLTMGRDSTGIHDLLALVQTAFFNMSRGRSECVFTLPWAEAESIQRPAFRIKFDSDFLSKLCEEEEILVGLRSSVKYHRLAANEFGPEASGYHLGDRSTYLLDAKKGLKRKDKALAAWIDRDGFWWLQLAVYYYYWDGARAKLLRSKVKTDHHLEAPPATGWRHMEDGEEVGDDLSAGIISVEAVEF